MKKTKYIVFLLAVLLFAPFSDIFVENIIAASANEIEQIGAVIDNIGATIDNSTSNQWNLYGTYGIQAEEAWEFTTGSREVRVGIIDTGIYEHNCFSDDNGNTNLAEGENFYNPNGSTNDTLWHGTNVAGIIGAMTNEVTGFSGVCPNVTLVPLKIANGGSWETEDVIEAIESASEYDIDIINFSGWNYGYNEEMRNAIDDFQGLFVTIAGNAGVNIDDNPNYPGAYNIDNMITVGAIQSDGSIWDSSDKTITSDDYNNVSNYGASSVDLFAPGGGIYNIGLNNGYIYSSGTSMAAPHVAGVAALLLSYDNSLEAEQLKDAIMMSVDFDSRYEGKCVTGGRLNAGKALNYVRAGLHEYESYLDFYEEDNEYLLAETRIVALQAKGTGWSPITTYSVYGIPPYQIAVYKYVEPENAQDEGSYNLVFSCSIAKYETYQDAIYWEENTYYCLWINPTIEIYNGKIYLTLEN